MTTDLTICLLYPQDRWNGYVLLHDGNGTPYIPEMPCGGHTQIGWCQAVMIFMRRIGTPNPWDTTYEYRND